MNMNDTTLPDLGPTKDRGYFCMACGSASVTVSELAGGTSKCNVCNWEGKTEEGMAVFPFAHESGSPDQVSRAFFLDLRTILGIMAGPISKFLLKWGFLDQPDGKNNKSVSKVLARYLGSMAKAMALSIVDTRSQMEKDEHGSQP
jgi:hypothetical protein